MSIGICLYPWTRRNCFSATSSPDSTQRSRWSPPCHRFTFLQTCSTIENADSTSRWCSTWSCAVASDSPFFSAKENCSRPIKALSGESQLLRSTGHSPRHNPLDNHAMETVHAGPRQSCRTTSCDGDDFSLSRSDVSSGPGQTNHLIPGGFGLDRAGACTRTYRSPSSEPTGRTCVGPRNTAFKNKIFMPSR